MADTIKKLNAHMEALLEKLPTGRQLEKAESALAKNLRDYSVKHRRYGAHVVTAEQHSEDFVVPFSPDKH